MALLLRTPCRWSQIRFAAHAPARWGGANALHRPTQEWSYLRSHEAQAEDESAYGTPREGGATNQSFQPLERATVAEGSAINPLDSP